MCLYQHRSSVKQFCSFKISLRILKNRFITSFLISSYVSKYNLSMFFNYFDIVFMVVSIYLSSLRTSETESWSSSFRFHFLSPPYDRYTTHYNPRAPPIIRKSYPPKNEQNIEYSSESFYMYVFFVLWCLIFLIYPFVIVIPQSPLQSGPLPYSNCFPIC